MALSDIKSIKVTEKRLNPNGQIVFDNYLKSFVSNYGVSWVLNNDQTLSIFNYDSPPINLPGIDNVYRGYAVGGQDKRLLASAYSPSMPKTILDLTGIKDIDGSHIHGLAITADNKISGWTMTGWAYAMGSRKWVGTAGTLWNQSRLAATGGMNLTGVKKIGADFQASFALLEGDTLTGWGNIGETWIEPSYSSITRPMAADKSLNARDLIGTGGNSSWGQNRILNTYTTGRCAGIALSENCRRKYSVVNGGLFAGDFTSAFLGEYISDSVPRDWSSVTSAYNGSVFATVKGGNIWKSNGWWTTPLSEVVVGGSVKDWSSISTDRFGQNVSAIVSGGNIWVSNDYGTSWVSKASARNWSDISMASGGRFQTAVVNGGGIWISHDSGNTWTEKGSTQNWTAVAVAQEGKYQTAVAAQGNIYISSDTGNNWSAVSTPGSRNWRDVSLSENGDIQFAVSDNTDNNGSIWVSSNTGQTWREVTSYATGHTNGVKGWNVVEAGKRIGNHNSQTELLVYFGSDESISGKIISNVTYFPLLTTPSQENPFASYPNVYLTGVKDFDIGENYINLLLKTGSDETYMLSGWGNIPNRLRRDGLENVKKIISTRDHAFALLKVGNTSKISGWGLEETNLDQFEQWLWASYGGTSGWFSGYLYGAKDWTGIKDFDIGYNHGIAVFENDKVSGWAGVRPSWNLGLVAQINNKYKNIDEREMNFFAPNYKTTDQELFFKNDATDSWEFKFNTFLDRWTFEVNSQVSYLSTIPGLDGLLGTWDGTGAYSGQELSVVNDTVQYIYPVEMGEAYISAMPDKDWIEVSTPNVIFPWNRTVGYFGGGAEYVDVFNLPYEIYYNKDHGPSTLSCNSNLGCPCDYSGELATFPTGNTIIPILNTFGDSGSWVTGSISGNISSIAISDSGKYQTIVISGGPIYISNNTGITWTSKESNRNWSDVSMTRDGLIQAAITSDLGKIWYSNNTGQSWSQKGAESNWERVFVSYGGDIVFAIDKSGEIYGYATEDMFGNQKEVWEDQLIQDWYSPIPIIGKPKSIAFDESYKNVSIVSSGGYITTTNDWGTTWQNRSISGNWKDIAMSFNGRYQTAVVDGGNRYISADSGVTWSSRGPARNWRRAAMSADGKYQSTIVSKNGFFTSGVGALGAIYCSKDFGDTWSLVTPFGSSFTGVDYQDIAVSHDAIHQVAVGYSSSIIRSEVDNDILGSVRLYPTKDFPLTVYRELSGSLSSDPVRFDKNYEVFLSQGRDKGGRWSISLKYRANSYDGETRIQEEKLIEIPRSIDKTGYALPPSGNWPSFYYRATPEPCAAKTQAHSGLYLTYSAITGALDTRTGFMQDVTFSLNYRKMLPEYSNKDQIYRYNDGYFNYSNFGGNISVEDATKCHKVLDFEPLLAPNTSWAINVAKFSADTAVDWNKSVTKPNCSLLSSNIYGPVTETPPRSKSGNNWYILLKYFGPTGWNFQGTTGSFYWPGAYILDKSSGTRTSLNAEIFNSDGTWSGLDTGVRQTISGACYHYQIRLSHPDLNVNSGSLDRNFWKHLPANCYSGGYHWNNIEDQGSMENASLVLQRGREYRFIQNGPVNNNNKLRIHPSSGVEVFEYDSDNPSEYHYIRLKIDSEDKNDQFINWSKGDRSYITGFTGDYIQSRGNYIIGNFYEINSSGVILDPSTPNFRKYPLNNFTGHWAYLSGESKTLGSVKYQDKIYEAEFWRLSGNQSFSAWPDNLNNGQRIDTAYAFIKTGNTKIPLYGIMEQTAKGININASNPSGNNAGQRSIWNGKFKIVGKNDYSVSANYMVEYPSPGQFTPFDMHICTDYNAANNPLSWPYLDQSPEVRSGVAYFSGINTTGYFFKNRDNRFYARKNILTQRNTINNIWFIPTTHARFDANELAFWTGLSANGPWGRVESSEASLWGGTSNFYNVNYVTYPDPEIKAMFGELWQLIQFYVPSTANINNIHIKIGPKSGDPTCLAQTGCRFTNISLVEDGGLPFATENGYYQYISGQDRFIGIKDFYNPSMPLFSGNLNIWSSDVYFKKQLPLGIKGPIDYIR